MLDTTTALAGQAERFPPDAQKKRACLTTTSDKPHTKNNSAATVTEAVPDCKQFADAQAMFALLGFELRTHCTAPGLVHRILDDDALPKASKPGRTTFIVGHWTGPRHVASWHAVIGLLASLQEAARKTTT